MSAPVQSRQPIQERLRRFAGGKERNAPLGSLDHAMLSAADRIEELENRVEYLQASEANEIATLKALLADTGRRVEEMEAALEFYADPESYKPQDRWCPARGNIQLQSDIQADNCSDKARAALSSGEAKP